MQLFGKKQKKQKQKEKGICLDLYFVNSYTKGEKYLSFTILNQKFEIYISLNFLHRGWRIFILQS